MIDSSVFPTEPDADDIVRGNLLLAASNAAIGIAPGVGRTQRASSRFRRLQPERRSMGVHRAGTHLTTTAPTPSTISTTLPSARRCYPMRTA
ncbi:hypothetical protein [Aminobacter sp. NyZ550]|uniref:hypothetical protein n=1 Tax=Aminobacter sp. NyZ550 TaxID=2979870 RepID=UPI0021D5B993